MDKKYMVRIWKVDPNTPLKPAGSHAQPFHNFRDDVMCKHWFTQNLHGKCWSKLDMVKVGSDQRIRTEVSPRSMLWFRHMTGRIGVRTFVPSELEESSLMRYGLNFQFFNFQLWIDFQWESQYWQFKMKFFQEMRFGDWLGDIFHRTTSLQLK